MSEFRGEWHVIKRNAAAAAIGAALVVMTSFAAPARAEEIEKKFRIGLALGGYNTQTEVSSDASHTLIIVDDRDTIVDVIRDPRNDAAAIGTLGIKASYRGTLTAAYAVTRYFVVEGSAGYQKGDLGDIEVQAQFQQQVIPDNQEFDMRIFRYNAGTVTQVPLEITALARFRPKAQLSPYIGGGVGYTFIGFEPSADLDSLSANMDASTGGLAVLTGSFGSRQFAGATSLRDLEGASVEARDTFEWHLAGGLEYSFKKRWAAYVDLRYVFASRALTLRFDGEKDFGRSVPDTIYNVNDPHAGDAYGGIQITQGGLVDGGRLVPLPTVPPDTNCAVEVSSCTFVDIPDGQVDPGVYYVKGGSIKYGGVALQFGIKFTF